VVLIFAFSVEVCYHWQRFGLMMNLMICTLLPDGLWHAVPIDISFLSISQSENNQLSHQ